MAVCAHGIGTTLEMWDAAAAALRACGLYVLRYDFYGHGWSIPAAPWPGYGPEMFMAQLGALLVHVLARGEEVEVFVGHSTGALVGLLACDDAPRPARRIRHLALISPCLWKCAPLTVRLADAMPNTMWALMRWPLRPLRLPAGAYLANTAAAFAVDAATGGFARPEAHAAAVARNRRMLSTHPFIEGAIAGICAFFFDEAHLRVWRERFRALCARPPHDAPRVTLLWGTADVVVSYQQHAAEAAAMAAPGRIALWPLRGLGHDSVFEEPEAVAAALAASVQQKLPPHHSRL